MKRSVLLYLLLVSGLFTSRSAYGQKGLLEGLLDGEEPQFHSTILPTEEDGVIRLAVYFTHSKMSAIEASFWIKDHGSNLLGEGQQKMVRGLQQMGNRQQDTLTIYGLSDRHFYSIGLDYRNASAINRKFTSKVIQEGYFYTFPTKSEPIAETPARQPQANNQQPAPPPPAAPDKTISQPAYTPCLTPELFVKVDPSGYCGEDNRPAVLIQCDNCQGSNWEFSVEIRQEYGPWMPIRRDGRRQPATGTAVRTEPLCLLAPGRYYLQVLAWGEGCQNPAIYNIGTTVNIAAKEATPVSAPLSTASPAPEVPDTCMVEAQALLQGNRINGTLKLEPGSPCADWSPVVGISYVHPGYRDITLGELPLFPGQITPFSIELEDRDLYRGIHTLQAVVYGSSASLPKRVPMYSFWIRAWEESDAMAMNREPAYGQGLNADARGGSVAMKGGDLPKTDDFNEEPPAMEENFQEVRVTASDPNCTQIQNLQLVYSPTQPDKPLYISWLNPRCCQEEGCEYSVWAGDNPRQLQLLVKGRKPGANITELLQGIESGNQYLEVVVRTPNGVRKAAFVPGEGPKYGIEEILDYQDRLNPQASDPVVGMKETTIKGDQPVAASTGVEGGLANRMGNAEIVPYEQPQLPATQFEPCRIYRETHVIGKKPIQDGDEIVIEYAYADKAYRYTLYHQPEGSSEWVLAPGTKELQESPSFELAARTFLSGKYVILTCKPDKSWGCLSSPLSEALEIKVLP